MEITAENIGDIFRLKETSQLIRIDEVSDKFIIISYENGDWQASANREVSGAIVNSPEVINRFKDNYELGSALNAAEFKARSIIADSKESEETHAEALSVLSSIKIQRDYLAKKIIQSDKEMFGIPAELHKSLDSMISGADKKAVCGNKSGVVLSNKREGER